RLLVTSTIAEFIATPLAEAFSRRWKGMFETTSGVASAAEMRVLLPNRLADVALGPDLGADPIPDRGLVNRGLVDRGLVDRSAGARGSGLISGPVLRYRMVVVAAPRLRLHGSPARWEWLVDPSGTDPDSDTGRLLRAYRVPEARIRVFPNQTAAWAAAA